MTIWHACGCFQWRDVFWPCCAHRGQTAEQRRADIEQHAIEGAAMNGWIGGTDGRAA